MCFSCPKSTKHHMGLQDNMQNQNMNLVLSTDAKPRLKWTPELHRRFVEAVNQLGGADKATPKGLMRVMDISGLTLYHLKSHLQKYRLGKSQQGDSCVDSEQEVLSGGDFREVYSSNGNFGADKNDKPPNQTNNESLQIAQALKVQMEVQKKLYEQIEVQRHLQLRIEAQGKYLQSVLKKAQETLSYTSCSSPVGLELAKAELSRLVSLVSSGCGSSSFSEITDLDGPSLKEKDINLIRRTMGSVESSLTSSESSGRKDDFKTKDEIEYGTRKLDAAFELPLMEINTGDKPLKRNNGGEPSDDAVCVEQPLSKKRFLGVHAEKLGDDLRLDLNSLYRHKDDDDDEPGRHEQLDLN